MELILIGLLGGLITGISPCILPVLPVIFLSGGAQSARRRPEPARVQASPTGGGTATATLAPPDVAAEARPVSKWRPYIVILGLVTSFTLVALVGSLILSLLGLPQDVIRWAGIVVLVLIGLGLIIPRFEQLLERPFQWIPRREVSTERNGFALGFALGAVYVPCAGPVLAAIIVAGSTGRIGLDTVLLTVSFAIGAALPLLFFALAGRALIERIRAFRKRERGLRIAGGIAMIALAVGLAFNLPALLQRLVPDYTAPLTQQLDENETVRDALDLGGLVTDENRKLDECSNGATELESCGTAPSIRGIDAWLNTPDGDGIDLKDLRGQVVLIDFWAYSCINCQRSIPHVVAWDEAYRDAGLQVIGIHSPEYAFEKDAGNVASGAKAFGIEYPVALDNSLSTWTNYRNRYWPAHYLIDAEGTVRHIAFGEGNYAATEKLIRELLESAHPGASLPAATEVEDTTPDAGATTPETFLGTAKDQNFGGSESYGQGEGSFSVPADQKGDTFALEGDWALATQYIEPTDGAATIALRYTGAEVRVVLSGTGSVTVTIDGGAPQTIPVEGTPRSYELYRGASGSGLIEVSVTPGVQAYSFTFG